jgi:hypothetical protein
MSCSVSKCFFSETTWRVETKLPRNDHWKVLFFFMPIGNPRWLPPQVVKKNQRLSRACIVHLVIKKNNWFFVKTMSCSGSHQFKRRFKKK